MTFKLPAHAVAITGVGLYTSLGRGLEENWQKLIQGQSGVRAISRFPTEYLPTKIAATLDIDGNGINRVCKTLEELLEQLLQQNHFSLEQFAQCPVTVALPPLMEIYWSRRLEFASLSFSQIAQDKIEDMLPYKSVNCAKVLQHIMNKYHFGTIPTVVNTACASGASAIQLAAQKIRSKQAPMSLVLAMDASVEPETVARFSLLSTLSTANATPSEASKPFSLNRDGFVLGEGAAALMLEDAAHAKKRGAKILAYLIGEGDVADNFHRTRSNPSGETIVACMNKALVDAQITPQQVDYINAHGTSTQENDKMEAKGIGLLFGDHCSKLLVSSSKSMLGHTLSAAGAIEAVLSVLTLQRQIVPPTINYQQPDPDIAFNVVPHQAIKAPIDIILSNSFGFGGQNVSLVFAKENA